LPKVNTLKGDLPMAQSEQAPLRRTIRRQQLRAMVPLADSTIYEMEQRGEFPLRFALSPRCVVGIWPRSKAGLRPGARNQSRARNILT
jgi:prophage regulatory protein